MFRLLKILTGGLLLVIVSTSTAEFKRLSDAELAQVMAQNGVLENGINLTINTYRENVQLDALFSTNQWLMERALYNQNDQLRDSANSINIEQRLEESLITLSTQLASMTASSGVSSILGAPVLGAPIGLGMSLAPGAFKIEVTNVSVNITADITIRE